MPKGLLGVVSVCVRVCSLVCVCVFSEVRVCVCVYMAGKDSKFSLLFYERC